MKFPSAYEPSEYESKIYSLWEQSSVFTADPSSEKEHFSISMPPPNETGALHAGHAIFLTLQDILARHARQQGKDVLWLPGTDHAALPVNALMEKQLAEQGTDKHKLGREEFLHQTRQFVATNRGKMTSQIRAIGASCDWGRARYTLDDTLNRCVNEVFVRMYKDGLIYRGSRIINWDPNLQTTISDDEVIHKQEKTPLYTLQFGPFQITTARPETKFGDKYVVMHPDDKRYAQYKAGDTFEVEWINGPITATAVKDQAVDPEFGTGVMTITPWHDHTDFEIAERHGLDKEQVIDFSGNLLPIAGEFAGMNILDARPKIVEKLEAKKLVVDVDEKYVHNLALNDRGKGVIEPQIKLQWFVDANRPVIEWHGQLRSIKEVMRAVIEDEEIQMLPERFKKTYYHWIDNLQDWCISRQIWWGHQIPVWYKGDETHVELEPPKESGWQQDPDTLDTWFSSALWTWSTLVNQDLATDESISLEELLKNSADFQTYHPTSVMETGWDILFFWVARMILSTTYTLRSVGLPEEKSLPFKAVFLHGLVRAESGKKMSKSDPEGNVDPLEIISEYGADALRLALVAGVSPSGSDQKLGKGRIAASRNFCNKLWNIARYADAQVSEYSEYSGDITPQTPADHWILNMLSIVSKKVNDDIEKFQFSEAYLTLYQFIWSSFADWYIEASKASISPDVLAHVLDSTLIVAHPFMPFVTEAAWQQLGWHKDELLASMQLPESFKAVDMDKVQEFDEIIKIVSEARRVKAAIGQLKPAASYTSEGIVEQNQRLIMQLAGLSSLDSESEQGSGIKLVMSGHQVWIDADETTVRTYVSSLDKHAKELETAVERLKMRLGDENYVASAPPEIVADTKTQLGEQEQLHKQVKDEIAGLKS